MNRGAPKVSRRRFVRTAGFGWAALWLPAIRISRAQPAPAGGTDAGDLLSRAAVLFTDPGDAAAIGRNYRAQVGTAAADIDAAAVDLLATLLDEARADGAGAMPARLRAAARQRVERDFARGVIIELDGWVLSRTEVLLCVAAELAGE